MKLQAWRSVYDKVAGFVKDEHVRQALSFHSLLVGGSPFATSSIYALIHALERRGGVWFPRGGTHALIRALVKLFEDLGGTIHLGSPIQKITTKAGRVTGVIRADSQFEAFDTVASNADVMHTYRHAAGGRPRGQEGRQGPGGQARWSPSLFVVALRAEDDPSEIRHHTICFGNRYRELIGEIYGKDGLADDFSLYLHHPTASDPAMAPRGLLGLLRPVAGAAIWRRPTSTGRSRGRSTATRSWPTWKSITFQGSRPIWSTSRSSPPDDFVTDLNAWKGAAFSLEPILTQSAFFRTHNRDDVIPNLYFVGAGTHPGAGIPGVVGSAKATAGLMIDDYETLDA